MKIELIKGYHDGPQTVEVQKETTAQDLYRRFRQELPYIVVAAKIDNRIESLEYRFTKDCTVEFLDLRTQAASLIYQNSLILLYLKAVEDVIGKVEVEIENAINQGLYTEIKSSELLHQRDVKAIELRMRELVHEDIPFIKEELTKEEAVARFAEMGCPEKITLLAENPTMKKVPFYSLSGYKDFFYSQMVPSTGYLNIFELRKYRRGVLLRFPQLSSPGEIPEYSDEKMLYQTFGEQTHWGKLMGINYVSDLNRKIEDGKIKDLIQLSKPSREEDNRDS